MISLCTEIVTLAIVIPCNLYVVFAFVERPLYKGGVRGAPTAIRGAS